jgi:lysophospholipase III
MKALVEETYSQNNNTSITIIAHSMGAPMTLLFLQGQTASWKTKHIARIMTLAGAWGGTAKAIKVFAIGECSSIYNLYGYYFYICAGDDLGSYALSGSVLREEQITSPSLAWLMPSKYFWKPDEILVRTNSTTYTFQNIRKFFQDLDYMTGWEMYQDTVKYQNDFSAPGVEVHCLYGYGVKTVEK